ncbi:unnamed protein product [Diamesa serratosioi]
MEKLKYPLKLEPVKLMKEEDIVRIINECDILLLPDEDDEDDNTVVVEAEEDFDAIYQQSKKSKKKEETQYEKLFGINENEFNPLGCDPVKALQVNRILKQKLAQFQRILRRLMIVIEDQFKANEDYLERAKNKNVSKEQHKGNARIGAPYFKDAHGDPAPLNQDYKYRKHVLKEFFPFDLPQNPARWKMREKVNLVNGIKNQMIDHIKVEQSKKLCQQRQTRQKIVKLKFISNNDELSKTSVLELYQEIQANYPSFKISWSNISFDILNSSHSITECMGIWYSYLRPDLNRSQFTEKENTDMMIAIVENNYQNWDNIASLCDRRSSMQCFIHYHKSITRFFERAEIWTPEEDDLLLKAIHKYTFCGAINWNKVGETVKNRTKMQCYNRYSLHCRDEPVKKGVFSREEDLIILNYIQKFGKRFDEMFKLLPDRSVTQIRNHYNNALKNEEETHPWTSAEDHELIEFVDTYGTNNWKDISLKLKTHNRISCRTRYITIQKYLDKHPNASIENVPKKHKKLTTIHKVKGQILVTNPLVRGEILNSDGFDKFKQYYPKLYHILKTCFNYDLGRKTIGVEQSVIINVLIMLLKVEWSGFQKKRHSFYTEQEKLRLNLAQEYCLDSELLKQISIIVPTHFLLPPNWNSVVGLRAIAIKNHLKDEEEDVIVNLKTNCNDTNYNKSLNEFHKLFFSLFYWSAIVSKIDSDELKEIYYKKNPQNYTAVDFISSLRSKDGGIQRNSLMIPKSKNKVIPKS